MIIEYSINNIREVYDNNLYNEDMEIIETLLSDKIEDHYIKSPIIHIFPITISLSITILLATYLLIR
jgi:hypothetical protein